MCGVGAVWGFEFGFCKRGSMEELFSVVCQLLESAERDGASGFGGG